MTRNLGDIEGRKQDHLKDRERYALLAPLGVPAIASSRFTYGALPGRRDFDFVASTNPPPQPLPRARATAQPDESTSSVRTIGKWFDLGSN